MKIVILDGGTVNTGDLSWSSIENFGTLEAYDRLPQEKVIEVATDADVIFTSKLKITADVMDACPNLKFIGVIATGYDNIDIQAAKERNIAVCNVPGYAKEPVAQHTFALMLEITNQVALHDRAVKTGEWTDSPDFCLVKTPVMQLCGKSLGIIGYGAIGKRVAEIGRAFGMEIRIYSQDPEATLKSDFISLHCPATAENKGFVNKEFISRMKDGVILINTARGALIQEEDLLEALVSGKVAAAGLDVMNGEPPRRDHPLFGAPNLFITSHMSWAALDARSTICETSAKNLASFLEGGNLNRIV